MVFLLWAGQELCAHRNAPGHAAWSRPFRRLSLNDGRTVQCALSSAPKEPGLGSKISLRQCRRKSPTLCLCKWYSGTIFHPWWLRCCLWLSMFMRTVHSKHPQLNLYHNEQIKTKAQADLTARERKNGGSYSKEDFGKTERRITRTRQGAWTNFLKLRWLIFVEIRIWNFEDLVMETT